MGRIKVFGALAAFVLSFSPPAGTEPALTDAQIAAIIVQASRDTYYRTGHPCACPEDPARNGSRCGARSAYSRPGGAAPYCYPSDVPTSEIESYRERFR
jgi:hypothetical protein